MWIDKYFVTIRHEDVDSKYKQHSGSEPVGSTKETTVHVFSRDQYEDAKTQATEGKKLRQILAEVAPLATGSSRCDSRDQFSRRTGIAIAAQKAFKLLKKGFRWDEERRSFVLLDGRKEVDISR
jgi:sarcosine oxidase gamma subunit